MALVEDGALLGSRQLDMGNSGLECVILLMLCNCLAGSASVGGLWGTEQVFILWLCVRPKTSLPLSATS